MIGELVGFFREIYFDISYQLIKENLLSQWWNKNYENIDFIYKNINIYNSLYFIIVLNLYFLVFKKKLYILLVEVFLNFKKF